MKKEKGTESPIAGFFNTHSIICGVILAFIGAFIGIYFVVKQPYREIQWQPKQVYSDVLSQHLKLPRNAVPFKKEVSAKKPVAKTAKPATVDTAADKMDTIITARKLRVDLMTDTQFMASVLKDRFRIDSARYLIRRNLDSLRAISVMVFDTVFTTHFLKGTVALNREDQRADEFFAKYPAIGFWALLIIAQFGLYFFLAPYAFVMLFGRKKDEIIEAQPFAGQRILYFLLVMLPIALYYRFVLYDSDIVKPSYMMPLLDTVLSTINIVAYSVIALLFAATLSAIPDIAWLKKDPANSTKYKKLLPRIESKVNDIFLLSGILLSIGILTTGGLFSGLNSLPFVKQLNKDLGYPIFSNDTVYLYGLIHSFILLLFFVPVRMKIAKEKAELNPPTPPVPGQPAPPAQDKTLSGTVSAVLKKLPDLLIASSPLIASLFKSLFDYITA